MKKKIFMLLAAVLAVVAMFTGCIQNDIGVKIRKDGSGSVSTTVGIEKHAYENLKSIGADPFEGKPTTEYTYEDSTYVAYTEVQEYNSYEEMEQALLAMSYETDLAEDLSYTEDFNKSDSESDNVTNTDIAMLPRDPEESGLEKRIFSSVNIEKNGGIFYSSYTFNAVTNPQTSLPADPDLGELQITVTVEMPEEVIQYKGGTAAGNKITFDISDITQSKEIAATCESNHTGVVVWIAAGLCVVVAGIFCFIKFKK